MDLNKWLKEHKDEIEELENGKIRCKLSGHDIPRKMDALQQHWSGRVYRRALKKKQLESGSKGIDFDKFAPYFVPHKRDTTKVFCKVTKFVLNNDEAEVNAHMKGRKFNFQLRFFRGKKSMDTQKPRESDANKDDEDDFWARAPAAVLESDEEDEIDEVEELEDLGFPVAAQVATNPKKRKFDNDDGNGDDIAEDTDSVQCNHMDAADDTKGESRELSKKTAKLNRQVVKQQGPSKPPQKAKYNTASLKGKGNVKKKKFVSK